MRSFCKKRAAKAFFLRLATHFFYILELEGYDASVAERQVIALSVGDGDAGISSEGMMEDGLCTISRLVYALDDVLTLLTLHREEEVSDKDGGGQKVVDHK